MRDGSVGPRIANAKEWLVMKYRNLLCAVVVAVPLFAGCASAQDSPPDAPVAAQSGADGARLVEPHAKGAFFDRRPLTAQVQRIAQASRPTADRIERVQVMDTTGFGQPLPAMTLDMPAGWRARGQVEWTREVECIGNTYDLRWSAASPDGLYEMSLLPRLSWQVESAGVVALNPCPAAPMRTAREYLDYMMRTARPAARALSYRERPDLVAALSAGGLPQGGTTLRIEAGELLIGYALAGQEMRETLVAAVTFSELQGSVAAWSDTGFALRAPEGQLDFALAERLRASARLEKPWGEQMLAWSRQRVEELNQRQVRSIAEWHQRRMSEITTAGMLARSRIRQDTIAQVGRINERIVADRSATDSRIHENFKDYVQEVQPWRDPASGGQVDLSIHYRHAWQLDDGRQFLTNDPNFDPNRDLGLGGHALQPAR
jgi:hypothetical protein